MNSGLLCCPATNEQRRVIEYVNLILFGEPIDERFEKLGTCELYRIKNNLSKGLPPG